MDHFEMLQVDISRLVNDTEVEEEHPIVPSSLGHHLVKPLVTSYAWWHRHYKFPQDPFTLSLERCNQFIALRLKEKKQKDSGCNGAFWVGNYHMPCANFNPIIMKTHAEKVMKKIQALAAKASLNSTTSPFQKDEYVLAGDFNVSPDSPYYRLFTEGMFVDDEDEVQIPVLFSGGEIGGTQKVDYDVENLIDIIKPMRSAYMLCNKEEPEYSAFIHTTPMERPFRKTVDYIFLSEGWCVNDVKPVPKIDFRNGPYPNVDEPSDHVMIAASLGLN